MDNVTQLALAVARKRAFVPMDQAAQGGPPPGDPSMGGGMPPGAPPGMPPGAPPGMDPAAMGAPPGMDPAAMGAPPPGAGAPGPGGNQDIGVLAQEVMAHIMQSQQGQGGQGGGQGGEAKKPKDPIMYDEVVKLRKQVGRLVLVVQRIADELQIQMPASDILSEEVDNSDHGLPQEGPAQAGGGAEPKAASIPYEEEGEVVAPPSAETISRSRQTLAGHLLSMAGHRS